MNTAPKNSAEVEKVNGFREDLRRKFNVRGDRLNEALAHIESLRAKLATVEAQAAWMREAVNIALEAYSFLTGGTREPISTTMKRPENDLRVFQLVIALNNLRKKADSTDCGQSLLARLEEARWLLSMSDLPSSKSNSPIKHEWYTRRDAWLSGHTASERLGKEAK